MSQQSILHATPPRIEASKKFFVNSSSHEPQVSSPTSAESSPPIVSRLKPRSQVPSPSSVGFSMHRIALALAASASAKQHILQSKRLIFDRFFVNCISRQRPLRCSYSTTLKQKYKKALETDKCLQQRLLKAVEIFSMRVTKIVFAAVKMFSFKKWRRIRLERSDFHSPYRVLHETFSAWCKAVLIGIAEQMVVHRKYATANAELQYASTGTPFQNESRHLIQDSSLSFKRIIRLIQLFDACFCRWKAYSRNEFSSRNKMLGITYSMERLTRIFTHRACNYEADVLPGEAPAFLEAGARIDYEKVRIRFQRHVLAAYFLMWTQLLPPSQVSALLHLKKAPSSPKSHAVNLDPSNITNHASPIIMAGTPPTFPMRPSPPKHFERQHSEGMCTSQNRLGSSDGESSLDADLYAAAVLMDHHKSLCDQSASQVSSSFKRKTKAHYLQTLESTSPNSIGEVSDVSSNPHSNNVFASTLRPLSPTTKAHVRNNIIVPSENSKASYSLLKKSNHSLDTLQDAQKIQAFKIVRSPPMAHMQDMSKERKAQVLSTKTENQAKRDVTYVGWGCFTGLDSDSSASRELPSSRQHGSFLSSAVAMRMRMSEELRTKELKDQKLNVGHQRHSGTFDTARQPWVRR
jgi:hypothetical protein